MATTRADRLAHDESILRAAAHRLALDPSATLQQIADDAGVSRLTLYRGFADRAALVTALRAAVDADLDVVITGLPAWGDGADVLAELVRALAGIASRYPIAVLRYAPVHGPPPPADAQIVAVLRAGQRAGALRRDVDAKDLNAMLFGTLAALVLGSGSATTIARTLITLLRSAFATPEGPPR